MFRYKRIASVCAIAVALTAPACADGAEGDAKRPDLNGTWTNASLTPLARARGVEGLIVSEERALEIATGTSVAGLPPEDARDAVYSDPDAPAPEKGGRDFGLKGYDSFWVAPGQNLGKVKGEYRTSYIVEPANGQIPYTDEAMPIIRARQAGGIRYLTGVGGNDGPENTSMAERCLIGFGQTGGPGMLSVLYNNTHEIVQTEDHVMILVEMNHDARVIPIFDTAEEAKANHMPSQIKPWLGNSVGWYADNALYIQTRNLHPGQMAEGAYPTTEDTVVTEKMTRYSDEEIFYEFTVEDPTLFKQPWKAELSFRPAEGRQYEYACHEGNYAMPGILYGARLAEREAAKANK